MAPTPEGPRGPAVLAGTREPLAALHDVALLDLDGVVYVGPDAVPHAADSLERARAHGMRAAFVTNNAARSSRVVAEHLTALGVPARAADVVTSAQAGARMVAERVPPGSRVLPVGGPGVAEALLARGLVPVSSMEEGPVAVLQGYGPDVGWRELAEACLCLERGALFVATNMDRTIPGPRGRVLGNGSMVAAVQHATGAVPLVAGKPEPPLLLESIERTGARRPLVVGDRLDTDIEGANRCSIPSLLVLTGVTEWIDLLEVAADLRPQYLDVDLRGLLRAQTVVTVHRSSGALHAECAGARVRVPVGAVPQASQGAASPGWWVPDRLREADVRGGQLLDAARAVVSVAWAVVDAGLTVEGPLALLS